VKDSLRGRIAPSPGNGLNTPVKASREGLSLGEVQSLSGYPEKDFPYGISALHWALLDHNPEAA
jgi:hypothetical protein